MYKNRVNPDYDIDRYVKLTQDIISCSLLLIGMIVACLAISLTIYYGWL